ncbi:hypothetical protein A2U01_0056842, partial [Trifolium medium]|nr:hypothetical protein [Trifolium medium]
EKRDLKENLVEVTAEISEVEGREVGEPLEEAAKDWIREGARESEATVIGDGDVLFIESERDSDTVDDGEQLFGNKRKRLQIAVVVISVEESDDTLPTLLW